MLAGLLSPWLTDGCLLTVSLCDLCTHISGISLHVQICFSYKDTSQIELQLCDG